MGRVRIAVIVQARMGSSRLPGKVLSKAGGYTLFELLARRLERAHGIDEVVIATTRAAADDAIADAAVRRGFGIFRGSDEDVLSRYQGAAEKAHADVVVRITADCPLIDPQELERVVDEFVRRMGSDGEVDYLSNQRGDDRRIPRGQDIEVMSRTALERAAHEATAPGDREHVTPYLYRDKGRFRTLVSDRPGRDLSRFRLTVDTADDLALVDAVVRELGPDASLDEIARLLDARPDLYALNAAVAQKDALGESERRRRRIGGRTLIGRADASPNIGLGHVARLGALLDGWTELGGAAILYGAGISGATRERLVNGGVEIVEAPAAEYAATPTLELGRRRNAVAVAIDGYAFDDAFLAALHDELPTLALDDFRLADRPADVVLDQNAGAAPQVASAAARSRVLAGSAYVLLRREFRQALSAPRDIEHDRRVLVSFGGSDPRGLTLPTVTALAGALPEDVSLDVVIGAGVDARMRHALDRLRTARIELHHDPHDLSLLMSRASLAVSAAGSTTWELCALGVPCVLVVVAENQSRVAATAASAGAAVDLGSVDSSRVERISEAVLDLLKQPERLHALGVRGKALVDGRGVWRVIDAMLDAVDARRDA